MTLSCVITAGGTVEKIDDVRTFSQHNILIPEGGGLRELSFAECFNISEGGFGLEIARAFTYAGVKTTLIGRTSLKNKLNASDRDLTFMPFSDVASLQNSIAECLKNQTPDFFLMAAAVSDYSPVAFEGKLSSKSDELLLRLKRNPKLLDGLRDSLGAKSTLLGFKLVSRLKQEDMEAIALAQNERADLDYTVANDLQKIDFVHGFHPISLVSAKGEVLNFSGARPFVAKALVEFLINNKKKG